MSGNAPLFIDMDSINKEVEAIGKVTETVTRKLTKEVIQKEGFELFDLEFVKGKIGFLRFTWINQSGIDLDDCAFMSENSVRFLMLKNQINSTGILLSFFTGAEHLREN